MHLLLLIPPIIIPVRKPWNNYMNRMVLSSFQLQFFLVLPLVAEAHFLFARVVNNKVIVTFSEPVAMEGDTIGYVSDKITPICMFQPDGEPTGGDNPVVPIKRDEIPLQLKKDRYLYGSLPTDYDANKLDKPALVSGWLNYGEFRPGINLQYTYSAQLSSTNPSSDWSNFFHHLGQIDHPKKHDENGPKKDPFAIVFRNFGPPYEIVPMGLPSPSTILDVCLYEYGTNRKMGCTSGNTKEAEHVLLDTIEESLKPCTTYVALANITVPDDDGDSATMTSWWSSTSITWDGPCAASSDSSFGGTINLLSSSTASDWIFLVGGLLAGLSCATYACRSNRKGYSVGNDLALEDDSMGGAYTDAPAAKTLEMT